MVVSSLTDSLKVLFSGDYEISDSDYKKLSDILVSNNVSEIAFDTGLVQIIKLMYDNGYTTPISLDLVRKTWSKENIQFNFVKMLVPLIKEGIIKLRKINCEVFKEKDFITKEPGECFNGNELHVVVYGSKVFNSIFEGFKEILSNYQKREITESVDIVNEGVSEPSKVKNAVQSINKLASALRVNISIESYMKDDSTGVEEINLICSDTSRYTLKDSDIQKLANKFIKKVSYVSSVEAYKEGNSELFIGITLQAQSNYKDMVNAVYNLIYDLEVNGVGEV